MTNEELDALMARGREALEGATPGPWHRDMSYQWPSKVRSMHPDHCHRWVVDVSSFPSAKHTLDDARFIAAARDLVPDLLDAHTALRAERDAMKAARDCMGNLWADAVARAALPEVQAIVEAAVKAEREACAKVCEEWGAWNNTAQAIAHVIRKRGEGKP